MALAMEHLPQEAAGLAPVHSFDELDANDDDTISWSEFLG
jgi:hypothetical protein